MNKQQYDHFLNEAKSNISSANDFYQRSKHSIILQRTVCEHINVALCYMLKCYIIMHNLSGNYIFVRDVEGLYDVLKSNNLSKDIPYELGRNISKITSWGNVSSKKSFPLYQREFLYNILRDLEKMYKNLKSSNGTPNPVKGNNGNKKYQLNYSLGSARTEITNVKE